MVQLYQQLALLGFSYCCEICKNNPLDKVSLTPEGHVIVEPTEYGLHCYMKESGVSDVQEAKDYLTHYVFKNK